MIYGDNPQKINQREDKLGLKTYTTIPKITAVMQSGNLYVYWINKMIIESGAPVKDASLSNGWKWVVDGFHNGAVGIWELVIDMDTYTIVHYVFRS